MHLQVGRGGALIETMTFNRMVVGSTPALTAMYGPCASPLPAVACALRRETPIHSFIHSFILETYIAPLQETTTQRRSDTVSVLKSGTPLSSTGLEGAL